MTDASKATAPTISTSVRPLLVRRAAVLGAGTMGSRIAAHLANAGIPTLLLDLPAKDAGPSFAEKGLGALGKAKPAALYESGLATLVSTGNFDEDLAKLAGCDWVIEAVAENLEIKTALLERVLPHLKKRCGADHQYFRAAYCENRRGAQLASGTVLRYALLQSAKIYAAA